MYAGVDKYSGALVGEGQSSGSSSHAPSASGLSLEDAIETAAAEETVVVDVPYSYLADDNDPKSIVSGVSTVLLSAQLNPEAGGLMWVENSSSKQAYKNVVAMSQMTSMLRDKDRNDCYERGIKRAIAKFKATRNRDPLVLDIGTGTGLLSMFAARHGAEHVYACEMFKPMAEIAHQVAQANYPDKITVFPLRSTDLKVLPENDHDRDPKIMYHLPRRADLLVSELFDSILLGEAVVPTIRHAMEHLLTSDAMIVPERATVFAQIIECDPIYHFTSFQMKSSGPKLARSDTAWQCQGGKPAIPVHFRAFEKHSRQLSNPTTVLKFDFTKLTTEVAGFNETVVNVVNTGTIDAVLMWWQVSFDEDNHIVYSTEMGAQNWQDHWVQVVFPLVGKVQACPSEKIVLRAHYDDIRIWFDVEPLNYQQKVISNDKPPCTCGMHLICNAERISMLTDITRREAFDASVALVVKELMKADSLRSISCLDISDGSLGALLAASLPEVSSVSSIESKEVSARIFNQILAYNNANVEVLNSGVKGLLSEHLQGKTSSVDLLIGEPFYYSMQNLPLWQAFNFWLRRTAVDGLLSQQAHVLPARARILAQVVQFRQLHQCFGAVGNVSGFDHTCFDQFQDEYYSHNFPFPVYMYPYNHVSEVSELASLDFMEMAHTVATSGSIEVLNLAANAVIVWVEYHLDITSKYVVTTGPAVRYAKQLVRFLPSDPDVTSGNELKSKVNFSFHFDALEGTIDLNFELEK
ncbi:protein arginine n-methyltransferase 7-like [Plasmopara halstedii]|uniref:Protein arginine N-methyltransferase n=1 Tax=Plasmopara halstedii TaxID=4781 RepID=A0A0P1B5X3_PLAHL|nr:protein arginine n-methyltransferase 7-like [Plasmopara halstedii]CEG49662.1 protein arginine n-methyltransferase 7-like [Plasmopara halstedii]|eukprot:XP_024586031.1 protein arginine n-methyltransferase 7-like [Plasmopara halstedii]